MVAVMGRFADRLARIERFLDLAPGNAVLPLGLRNWIKSRGPESLVGIKSRVPEFLES